MHYGGVPAKRATTPTPKPGSQSALRRRNSQLIIDTLARRGPTTQATLSRVTGLSTGTVSNLVKLLESADLVSSTPTIDSGRRALAIGLRAGGRLVAGISVGRNSLRILLSGLDQRIVAEAHAPLPRGHAPADSFAAAARLLDETLTRHQLDPSMVAQVGISLPAVLDRTASTMLAPDALLPNWEDVVLLPLAEATLGLPCVLDNDANLGALAQVTFGPFKDTADLAYVKVAAGIGAGLILDHELRRGGLGTAGEIGHTMVVSNGEYCRCGNRGCLETLASTTRISARVARELRTSLTDESLISLARQREPHTLRALEDAGSSLGVAVASLCSLLNPTAVVIGGTITAVGAPLMDPLYRAFHRQSFSGLAHKTTLVANQLGSRTDALGAIALAIRSVPVSPSS